MIVTVAGSSLTLNPDAPHEQRYAEALMTGARYPQMDVDRLLYERLMRPGDRVLDAGANIGLTALQALQAGASEVFCLEPVRELADRIRAIGDPRVRVEAMALGDRIGYAEITLSQSHNQGSTTSADLIELFRPIYGETLQQRTVPVVTIDALAENHRPFDVWKLDVEGVETAALQGASRVLQQNPPRVIIAELYPSVEARFRSLVSVTHATAYRALIRASTYELELAPADMVPEVESYEPTSPMFAFLL